MTKRNLSHASQEDACPPPPTKRQKTNTSSSLLELPSDIQCHILKFTHAIDRGNTRCAISPRQSASCCPDLHDPQKISWDQQMVAFLYALRRYPRAFFTSEQLEKNVSTLFRSSYDPRTKCADPAFDEIVRWCPEIKTKMALITAQMDVLFLEMRHMPPQQESISDRIWKMKFDMTYVPNKEDILLFFQQKENEYGADWMFNIYTMTDLFMMRPNAFRKCTAALLDICPADKTHIIKNNILGEGLFTMIYYQNEDLLRDILLTDRAEDAANCFYDINLMHIQRDGQFTLISKYGDSVRLCLKYRHHMLSCVTREKLCFMWEQCIKNAYLRNAHLLLRYLIRHHMQP